eukprot:1913686-Prymnesium_polylepis.1
MDGGGGVCGEAMDGGGGVWGKLWMEGWGLEDRLSTDGTICRPSAADLSVGDGAMQWKEAGHLTNGRVQ